MSCRLTEKYIEVFNPATGEDLENVPITTPKEIDVILASSKQFTDWGDFSVKARGKVIQKFQHEVVKEMDNFIETICSETGKKSPEGLLEVFTSLGHVKESIKIARRTLKKDKRSVGLMKTKKAWVQYEPMGVAGIISPWNYPLILTLTPVVEALLAGNTVVLKPSEQTPLTTVLLKKVWDKSTQLPEVFQTVYGGGDVGNQIVTSNKTDMICFTGSTLVGRKIAEVCAPLFKPVILELGGKDPLIVLNDAKIDRTVNAVMWGAFSNAGQTCTSVERVFVHESIFDLFISKCETEIAKLSSGSDENCHIGAISVEAGIDKINEQVNDVRNKCKVIEGVKGQTKWFIPPTIVVNPPLDAPISTEESFGPIMTITPFSTDEEVIELANNTGFGLSASVFGKNKNHISKIVNQLKAGSVAINDVMTQYGIADLPFGGTGLSGIGRVHGPEGLKAFSHIKSVMDTRISQKSEFWWFKNRKKTEKWLKMVLNRLF